MSFVSSHLKKLCNPVLEYYAGCSALETRSIDRSVEALLSTVNTWLSLFCSIDISCSVSCDLLLLRVLMIVDHSKPPMNLFIWLIVNVCYELGMHRPAQYSHGVLC